MSRRKLDEDDRDVSHAIPIPIQTFLWRQTSPFIRPKLGKLHEATCVFCQHAPGHHEIKEACKSFEKVLVQNIQFGLSPSLTAAIRSVPRWRLIQAAFPHVMHCAAQLLNNRKETSFSNLGAAETKLLYTLHWILLDSAEECAEADFEHGLLHLTPFAYLFSVPAITLFVYLFAPLCHHLKESDFQNFRLENGMKLWPAMWEYRHPDTSCFTAHVKPKRPRLWLKRIAKATNVNTQFGDVFLGKANLEEGVWGTESPASQAISTSPSEVTPEPRPEAPSAEDEEAAFPETIPEESSSNGEEHVVILRLGSLPESDSLKVSSIYKVPAQPESSLLHMAIKQSSIDSSKSSKASPTAEFHLGEAGKHPQGASAPHHRKGSAVDKDFVQHKLNAALKGGLSPPLTDLCMATFLDVAVLRCLFTPQWAEEGVFWGLQFLYHRLQEISDESASEQQPRRRSNSLPIPKIEISLYQSPELKKKETKDFIEVPESVAHAPSESPYSSRKTVSRDGNDHSPSRRSSEKGKRARMKMSDLKAFVETKLLSKSEKTLEKIGREPECKSSLSDFQDYPTDSLDTGDGENPPRPRSALAKIFEQRPDGFPDKPKHSSGLVKGKSMPSLRYIGDMRLEKTKLMKPPPSHPQGAPNPIITVTEHTPTPSPECLQRQLHGSIESHLDSLGLRPRHSNLTRSQTDSNIAYTVCELQEAPASSHYITRDGEIDCHVVLKAVHAVSLRDNSITLRVCEVVLNLLELLLNIGVIQPPNHEYQDREIPKRRNIDERNCDQVIAHNLFMECVSRIFKQLGCPHGCGEGQRGPPADFLRSQGQNLFTRLHRLNQKQFACFLRNLVQQKPLPEVLDLFHAFLGFCLNPGSLLSPLNHKWNLSKGPGADLSTQGGYTTNFGAGLGGGGARGIEGHIVTTTFKTLVTRMVTSLKDLKNPENMALYCDVRQLMTYVLEVHGGVFRRVSLSSLLESSDRPHKRQQKTQTARVFRHMHHMESDDPMSFYLLDETQQEKTSKKSLFKKKTSNVTAAAIAEAELIDESGRLTQSPSGAIQRKHQALLSKATELFERTGDGAVAKAPKGRFHIGSWFRHGHGSSHQEKLEPVEKHLNDSDSPIEGSVVRRASQPHKTAKLTHKSSSSQMGLTLQRARKRMEDQLTKFGFGKGKRKDGSFDEAPDLSRRNSSDSLGHGRESEYVVLKERKLVQIEPVRIGMQRLAFMLETCQPGAVPDPPLLAAILELPSAPLVSKAAFFIEVTYFVHCCNRGQWPTWMKLNLPMFRPSGPLANRGTPSGLRRSHLLQRQAGRLFYQWAEAVGSRLEELMLTQQSEVTDPNAEDSKQKDMVLRDEDEDFLDEASVNPSGMTCPPALKLVACMLLLEITAFLRETYQGLPKGTRLSGRERVAMGGPPPWERERALSQAAPRRWSMALSSMGHSQASAQSLQSIAGETHAAQGERKISFVLHEPDNESLGSSNTTVTAQGEEAAVEEKKPRRVAQGRPFLLRKGTTGMGSFKRQSIKLRRSNKEKKDSDSDSMKRSDSVSSAKRKVSSISDRSDTSDHGEPEASGEESPGVLSDEQAPDSPNDANDATDVSLAKNMPWLKVVIQMTSSFNFCCTHQGCCHPLCYRRQMRACFRLTKAVRKIYGEEMPFTSELEYEAGMGSIQRTREEVRKEKSTLRKASEQGMMGSPIRRKESLAKKNRIDKSIDTSLISRIGSHPDSGTHLAVEADLEKGREGAAEADSGEETEPEEPPILKYLKSQVKELFHAPLSLLAKGAGILSEEQLISISPMVWELLLEPGQETAAASAALFILAAIKAPDHIQELMRSDLEHSDPAYRINAILRFQVLWKCRHQVWPHMEEGAHMSFKVPPPGIEFTLPSPKIGIESLPVVDPPWMPQVKTKVEEVTLNQDTHRALVTATKTRKKQQAELVKMALQAEEDKKRSERESFLLTTIPITAQAAYEPSLYHAVGDDHEEGDEEQVETIARNTPHIQASQFLFPSCLCAAVAHIINLLDDAAVSLDGIAVYEVAYQVIWTCLVEDSALFLRYILEKLTRGKQDLMFKILRRLILFVPKLPQQAAFALYNYIIGYVMFYVRSPQEAGQELIGSALSVLWMVVHSVQGIMFKDLKQILRKEQCDASILLTANVPSAKKIIVHGPQGPDSGGIPSQFPVQEDTQFIQILRESLDFFSIDETQHHEFFLVDHKTHQIHNPNAYVRDFYFFKRSQYPQLSLVHMEPQEAYHALQRQSFILKFVEIGKVMLIWSILKNVDMVVQRVVFLHEELMKLPSFPRKALEADLDLYKGGAMGKELHGLEVLHKFMWVKLIARMFEAMAGNFAYSGDVHLFLNVLSGALALHSQDACILRYSITAFINAAQQFKNIFSTNGYLLIMPTLLLIYSNHQSNELVTGAVEFACKQFYLMHRKPFILQMFGSIATLLDTDEDSSFGDATKVQSSCLFRLLLSLETPTDDPLNIQELVRGDRPPKALDFCYHEDSDSITVLDCISMCVMVIAYAADSQRGHQMLAILEAILPFYMAHIQRTGNKKETRAEKEAIHHIAVAMKTLINNCEALAKNYTGPQKASPDFKGSSQRNYSAGPYSPGFEFDEDSHSRYMSDHSRNKMMYERDMEDSEVLRDEFRRPRDILLSLVADFLSRGSARLAELNKKSGHDGKSIELLDTKSHVRLADVAHSLLKVSPYDPVTMGCKGLQRYLNEILPSTEWANEAMRPALLTILRRLDKTFSKIYKKPSIRRHTDWDAAGGLLKGVYQTLSKYPYIVHLQHMKTLINTCQSLILGESAPTALGESLSAASAALMSQVPPPHFCSMVVRLIAMQILALGETYSLEQVCGGSSIFPTQEKTENVLLNLLLPLCLRVGSGRKDIPQLRPTDISFSLTVLLHALNPPAAKTVPLTAQLLKTVAEIRTGSLVAQAGADRAHARLKVAVQKVAFLGLKIMSVCFEEELALDWPRAARTIREVGGRGEGGLALWNFLDFTVTHRTPLFILLRPCIANKLASSVNSDQERHFQFVMREKFRGFGVPPPKCRGSLLLELAHELKQLKEELETRKEELDPRKSDLHSDVSNNSGASRQRQRPSLTELLQSGLAKISSNPTEVTQKGSMSSGSMGSGRSALNREMSVREGRSGLHVSLNTAGGRGSTSAVKRFLRRVSYAGESTPGIPEMSELPSPSTSAIGGSEVNGGGGGNGAGASGSAGTPTSASAGDPNQPRHRLQRQKAQSRKTFRFRKSRKGNIEVSHIEVEPQELPKVSSGKQVSIEEESLQQLSVSAMPEVELHPAAGSARLRKMSSRYRWASKKTVSVSSTKDSSQEAVMADDDSIMSKTSSTSGYRESFGSAERYSLQMLEKLDRGDYSENQHHSPHLQGTIRQASMAGGSGSSSSSSGSAGINGSPLQHTPWDFPEPPVVQEVQPPTSKSEETLMPEVSSPDSVSVAEDTALLQSTHRSASRQSLLMVFESRDEDTLI